MFKLIKNTSEKSIYLFNQYTIRFDILHILNQILNSAYQVLILQDKRRKAVSYTHLRAHET